MNQKISNLKILRILTFSLAALDFLIGIGSVIIARYGYIFEARLLLSLVYNFLIPLTGFLAIITFIYNMKYSYAQKRTAKQELEVNQRFWGRIILIAISVLIMFLYIFFRNLDDYGMMLMLLLIILSIIIGPVFGRLIIKNNKK